jgi:hypothetical protein
VEVLFGMFPKWETSWLRLMGGMFLIYY